MDKGFELETEEDIIVIEDEHGAETTYTIDAMIEMNQKKYILYSNGDDVLASHLRQTDEGEFLEDITDEEMEELLAAYNQALKEDETK